MPLLALPTQCLHLLAKKTLPLQEFAAQASHLSMDGILGFFRDQMRLQMLQRQTHGCQADSRSLTQRITAHQLSAATDMQAAYPFLAAALPVKGDRLQST